jgi:hypothetical protein
MSELSIQEQKKEQNLFFLNDLFNREYLDCSIYGLCKDTFVAVFLLFLLSLLFAGVTQLYSLRSCVSV